MSTILIVYDNELARNMLCEILRSRGFTMISASSTKEGLKEIQQRIPDLIICDHEPPNLNGLEFLQNLKSDQKIAAIPLILCTAENQNIEQVAQQAGAATSIIKPFKLHLLTDAIEAQLQ